jgi:hypothetical protein
MDIQIIGIIIVGGVFGTGFLGLSICMFLDKSHRNYIRKPPSWLNNNKP